MPDVLASVMAALHTVDPAPIRARLASVDGVATTIPEMLDSLRSSSVRFARSDLAQVAQWLIDHPCASAPDVVCHGDLHPFNVLSDQDGRVTLLDWSAALLAPRAYDVAFTSSCWPTLPLEYLDPCEGRCVRGSPSAWISGTCRMCPGSSACSIRGTDRTWIPGRWFG
jgi:aminoglycoside phosphotransferase (APT) family kinase protein